MIFLITENIVGTIIVIIINYNYNVEFFFILP